MKLDELIETLKKIREERGNLEVRVQTISHLWDPEPKVRRADQGVDYVLLNP